jgi:hypothetical protein
MCIVISKKYGLEYFESDFCKCSASTKELKKTDTVLEKNYSKFDQRRLDRIFGTVNPFNPNGDIKEELDEISKKK